MRSGKGPLLLLHLPLFQGVMGDERSSVRRVRRVEMIEQVRVSVAVGDVAGVGRDFVVFYSQLTSEQLRRLKGKKSIKCD